MFILKNFWKIDPLSECFYPNIKKFYYLHKSLFHIASRIIINKENNNAITREEFNTIVNRLINENNQLTKENEELKRQLSKLQKMNAYYANIIGFNQQ